jgi:hypothetical protein
LACVALVSVGFEKASVCTTFLGIVAPTFHHPARTLSSQEVAAQNSLEFFGEDSHEGLLSREGQGMEYWVYVLDPHQTGESLPGPAPGGMPYTADAIPDGMFDQAVLRPPFHAASYCIARTCCSDHESFVGDILAGRKSYNAVHVETRADKVWAYTAGAAADIWLSAGVDSQHALHFCSPLRLLLGYCI